MVGLLSASTFGSCLFLSGLDFGMSNWCVGTRQQAWSGRWQMWLLPPSTPFPRCHCFLILGLAGAWCGLSTSFRDPPTSLHLAGSLLKGTPPPPPTFSSVYMPCHPECCCCLLLQIHSQCPAVANSPVCGSEQGLASLAQDLLYRLPPVCPPPPPCLGELAMTRHWNMEQVIESWVVQLLNAREGCVRGSFKQWPS